MKISWLRMINVSIQSYTAIVASLGSVTFILLWGFVVVIDFDVLPVLFFIMFVSGIISHFIVVFLDRYTFLGRWGENYETKRWREKYFELLAKNEKEGYKK